jgi:hypothetical protein
MALQRQSKLANLAGALLGFEDIPDFSAVSVNPIASPPTPRHVAPKAQSVHVTIEDSAAPTVAISDPASGLAIDPSVSVAASDPPGLYIAAIHSAAAVTSAASSNTPPSRVTVPSPSAVAPSAAPGQASTLVSSTSVFQSSGLVTTTETLPTTSPTGSTTNVVTAPEPIAPADTQPIQPATLAPLSQPGAFSPTAPTALLSSITVPNAIVLENQLTGNPRSEWDLSRPGSTNIEGFATDISVNHGQTVSFKIDTNSTNYRVDIYRLGYYGGMGARKVATLQHQSPTAINQPAPIVDPTTGEVDAGNWKVTDSWNIPSDAVSGVYIAKLVREDGTFGENQIPFIVRDDSSHSDVVFQTSDETWQAYNGWGGANLYGGNGPSTSPGTIGAAYAVSYNRPITTRDGGGTFSGPQDYLFGAEYGQLQWMEQQGYDISYIAGLDTDRFGSLLLNHKVFTSTGHDEYWSGAQRANVEAARAAGVSLAFFSGNEVYWKTRLAPSIDGTATANRTLVSYKETRADAKIDPSTQWTGTWRDPRFSPPSDGGRPENALTGTEFAVDSYRTDAITIPYADTQLRFWRNTAVANTAVGGTASLVQNLLGYEWDSSPDNGFRPAGLIDLSSTTLSVSTKLLDYGQNTGNGTVTHNLTLYRDPTSGALVFGAGTVFWSWGLNANHDLTATPTDPNVQQATVNLFADMGVQPQTLQASLVLATQSTDHTAPVAVISSIVGGASVVEGRTVTITGTASDTGGIVAGVEVSADGGVTWHQATGTTNWTYSFISAGPGTYTLEARASDDSVNLSAASAGTTLTVTPAGALTLFLPTDTPATASVTDSTAAELGFRFQASGNGFINGLRFYKGSQNTGTHVADLWTAAGVLIATATFVNETATGWQQVLFSSPVAITAGTTYVASYHTNVGHYADSPYAFDVQSLSRGSLTAPGNGGDGVFAYGASPLFPSKLSANGDNYFVDVIYRSAAAGTTPIAGDVLGLTATENLPDSIAAATLLAQDSSPAGYTLTVSGVSNPTNGTVSYDPLAKVVTFTPAAGITGPASFTYSIDDGHGGGASGNVALNVVYPVSEQSLFTSGDLPAVSDTADNSAIEVGVKFQVSVTGTITGLRFYKGVGNTGTHVAHLWNSTGTLLATATFTSETATGWQYVSFATPVAVLAGTTYLASYHTDTGNYASTAGYFSTAHTDGEITALAASNGVYAYGAGTFPTSSFNSTNYWVDVVFNGATTQPPVAGAVTGLVATENTATVISAASLLAQDTSPAGYALTVTGVSQPSNGTVTYDAVAQTVTFTPIAGYTGPAGFTYSISDGHGGTASGSASVAVNYPINAQSLFSSADTPAVPDTNDNSSLELGVKFQASVAGNITGLRFYKGVGNTGTHIADLWSSTGVNLATATFTNETATGWQQVNFATPVSITAGTTYVASYHTNTGNYANTANYFSTAHTNGELTAPAGTDGVYVYGASAFPTNNYNATNYWVDVVFDGTPASGVAVASFSTAAFSSTSTPTTTTAPVSTNQLRTAPLTFLSPDGSTQSISSVVTATGRGTIALPAIGGGVEEILGFQPNGADVLNLHAALASTNWAGDQGSLADYLVVTASGSDTVLSVTPDPLGPALPVGVIKGPAPITLTDLLAQNRLAA